MARSLTSIVGRCNPNSAIGLEYGEFRVLKGYLTRLEEGDRTLHKTSDNAGDYLSLSRGCTRNSTTEARSSDWDSPVRLGCSR